MKNDNNIRKKELKKEVKEQKDQESTVSSITDEQKPQEEKSEQNNYYDQLIRLKAEFENYRKRVEREKENHRLWGKEEILMKQISLYDVIGKALDSIRTTKNIESIIVGLEMIQKEFEKMLNSEGIFEIDTSGNFDPHLHEVVETLSDESQADGKIISVLQKGYVFNDRILRPAKVKIVKNENKKETAEREQRTGDREQGTEKT